MAAVLPTISDQEGLLPASPESPKAEGWLSAPALRVLIGCTAVIGIAGVGAYCYAENHGEDFPVKVLSLLPEGSSAPGGDLDRLVFLGKGYCVNHLGSHFVDLDSVDSRAWSVGEDLQEDGRSYEAERLCLSNPLCTGVATLAPNKYALVTKATKDRGRARYSLSELLRLGNRSKTVGHVYPASTDGRYGASCYWRQTFKKDSGSLYQQTSKPVPKIIWSFWEGHAVTPFVKFSEETWKQLHAKDGWTVRVVNETSKWNWLSKGDLPDNYNKHELGHRVDIVRMALLAKHGGVWIDPSTALLEPITDILGEDLTRRGFLTRTGALKTLGNIGEDARIPKELFVYKTFLAAPPSDPFFEKMKDCVFNLQNLTLQGRTDEKERKRAIINLTLKGRKMWPKIDFFSDEQLEFLASLAVFQYSSFKMRYMSTTACFVKEITDDRAAWDWFHSDSFSKVNAHEAAFWLYPTEGEKTLFDEVKVGTMLADYGYRVIDMFRRGASSEAKMMKITRGIEAAYLHGTRADRYKSIWCRKSVLGHILHAHRLQSPVDCNASTTEVSPS